MASCMDNHELAFRRMMNRVAKALTNANCESLQFVYKIKKPIIQKDIPGLDAMEELLSKGIFSYQNPDGLKDVLAGIDRLDLASLVTEYQQGLVQKQSNKKSSFKWSKNKPEETTKSERTPQSGNMLSTALMTVLNINSHTQMLVEEAAIEAQLSTKKELAAIADIKKNYEKLKESLKKAVSVVIETHPIESRRVVSIEESKLPSLSSVKRKRPVPPPKPDKPRSSLPISLTSPNLSSLASSGSSEIVSSSSLSRSEDDNKVKYMGIKIPQETSPEQESQTGDSGFNDDSWGKTALPVKPRNNAVLDSSSQPLLASCSDKEEPDYDQPWHRQETQYTELRTDTREEDHAYS